MTNIPCDTPSSVRRKPVRTSIQAEANANGARVALDLRDDAAVIDLRADEHLFEVPARLFEQLPFAVYVCDRDGLVLRYNRRAAELWGRSPILGDPDERFCGSYRMYRADGSRLPHNQCPMADVLRTGVSVRQQEVHIERPDGTRGIALVDIEALRDGDGNIVGAVNCFQDITERKHAEEHTCSCTRWIIVRRTCWHWRRQLCISRKLTLLKSSRWQSRDASKPSQMPICCLADTRWAGANLHDLVTQELAP